MFRLQGISGGEKSNLVARPYHPWINRALDPLNAADHFEIITAVYVRYRIEGDIVKIDLPLGVNRNKRVRAPKYLGAEVIFTEESWKSRTQSEFHQLFALHVEDAYMFIIDYAARKKILKNRAVTEEAILGIFKRFRETDFSGKHILWPGVQD
jgi:hypothetical protein